MFKHTSKRITYMWQSRIRLFKKNGKHYKCRYMEMETIPTVQFI